MHPKEQQQPPRTAPSHDRKTSIEPLWQRWRQDQCPDFPAGGPHADQALAVLRYDQCERWRSGDRVPAESYLERYSALKSDPEQAIVLIYGELVLRQELGEKPTLDEYLRRFPQYSEQLRQQDEFNRAMEGISWLGPGNPLQPSTIPGQAGACRVVGEIARGGMGIILKGHDEHFGRDLAIKILRDEYKNRPDVVRRFLEEAQVSGQLQHPGIVPVHELGRFEDGRPYFTMKLVQGRTLADLLSERSDKRPACPDPLPTSGPLVATDLPRFLKIFEQVCQTVAYAHARGVIHRDLKPANIMVGAFGEVQVMDWGLAKRLQIAEGKLKIAEKARNEAEISAQSSIFNLQSTMPGAVVGTPAYMAPEQARGEVDLLDERCDVFGLGAILCEILTGQPPYTGRQAQEVLPQAKQADLAGARARLEGCGADTELVGLARGCLEPATEGRLRDAGVVAERVTAYLAGVQERLQAAEVERAAAQARAEEAAAKAAAERRARRLMGGLAAAAVGLLLLTGGGGLWIKGQRDARTAAFRVGMDQAARLLDEGKWDAARTALLALPEPGDEQNRVWAREFLADLDMLERVIEIWASKADRFGPADDDAEYARAFREYGIDVDALDVEVAAAQIRARPGVVARQLVGAIIDWAEVRRQQQGDSPHQRRLIAVARLSDPNPWRIELLDFRDRKDIPALRRLADDHDTLTQPAQNLQLLGWFLNEADGPAAAVSFLWKVQRRYPSDPWINRDLAYRLDQLRPPRRDEAIGFYRAATAVRPELTHQLAKTLALKGDMDEAIILYQELTRSRPHFVQAFNNLGAALRLQGRWVEALAALEEAIRLRPDYPMPHIERALLQKELGRLDEASASWIEALRLHDEAIRLRPDSVKLHIDRSQILMELGRLDEAIASWNETLHVKPDTAIAYRYLGAIFMQKGWTDKATAALLKALEIDPKLADAHFGLGNVLNANGRMDEAIAAFQKAIALDPKFAPAYSNLGNVLQGQGRFEEAVAAHQKAVALHPKSAQFAQSLARCERLLALERRLPALLRGEAQPKDTQERLLLANLCEQPGKRLYATAARFYEGAFAAEPKQAENLKAGHRYNAACTAALAGCGQGIDDPPPDEQARIHWRNQALAWLRADLRLWAKLAESGPPSPANVQQTLRHWQSDPDLAGLRDVPGLSKLPEEERDSWKKLWADVDALLKR